MRVGLADMISLSTLSMYMSRTGSRFGGGHQVLLSRKGLGLKSRLFWVSKKYSLRRKRREKSLMSALTWVQSMCLAVGQKVNLLDRRSVSSSVNWTLDRLITVDVSRRIGPFPLVYDLDLHKYPYPGIYYIIFKVYYIGLYSKISTDPGFVLLWLNRF